MKNNVFILIIIFLIFQSCYKEPSFTNFDYNTYNRIVGPLGGTIDFYSNYGNDKGNKVIVSLDVPAGALDSTLVFNMYQFEDYDLVLQMERGFSRFGSKLLYFVPFYESEGYHEHGQLDLSYHLSVEFNEPISVNYNFLVSANSLSIDDWQDSQLYNDFYKKANNSYRLYRIKIPKLDEWGEYNNIYVNWNNQGYASGYDESDLKYIISGAWSPLNDRGEGTISLENWELVEEYDLNASAKTVSFDIYDTDYIYVLAKIIYIKSEDVPVKIVESLNDIYPTLEIERASYDGTNFSVYLSDNSYATYSKKSDFGYITNDHFDEQYLPLNAKSYIDANYSNDLIRKVKLIKSMTWENYEILLSSGIKLFFDGAGTLTGSFQYDFDKSGLPSEAISFLSQNHIGEAITNVTFDNENVDNIRYIVYLSSDAKVYFDEYGAWIQTLYYRVKQDKLPVKIVRYFYNNYKGSPFSEINFIQLAGDAIYEITLVGDKWFQFDKNGYLLQKEISNLDKGDLPTSISTYINTHFPTKEISEITYHFYFDEVTGDPIENYDVYFTDLLNVEFDLLGTVLALYGQNSFHLPLPIRTYLENNYPNLTLLNCSFDIDGYTSYIGNENVNHNWELYLSGELWVGIDSDLNFIYMQDFDVSVGNLIAPIALYLTTSYPSETVVELSNYFSSIYGQMVYYLSLSDNTELLFGELGNFLVQLKKANSNKIKTVKTRKIHKKESKIIERYIEKESITTNN